MNLNPLNFIVLGITGFAVVHVLMGVFLSS